MTRLLTSIFLFSFSALSYEVVLTRIFSISLWYHFAFMVISIAMLGIGASGTFLSLYPKFKDPSKIGIYGLLVGAGISLSYIISNQIPFDPARLSWDRMQILYICVYYILLSMPFFFFGMIIATAFSSISGKSGLVYSADLLGAGTGSLSILLLMNIMNPEKAVLSASCAALTGAFITGEKRVRLIALSLIAAVALLLAMPEIISVRMSPYKGLQLALKYPGAIHLKTYYSPFSRIDVFKSPAVRFAPGLSLKYLDPLPEQTGISIDGGELNAVTDARDRESLGFLKYLPAAVIYETGKTGDVLILEPKGGLNILMAEYYGPKNIYKVDSDPLIIDVIRNDFKNISDIYGNNTWTGLGRSWLMSKDDKFDIIDMPFLGASPSGAFGISEDYRFTVEAFKEYMSHLKVDGILGITLFIIPPPRTELRLLNTIIAAMEEMGIKDIDRNIAAIRSWGTVSILAKASPFRPEEIEAIRKFSEERRFDLIYHPGVKEEETNIFVRMPSNEFFRAFKNIIDPKTRGEFERGYIFDIKPVRDENPFFHYYLRLKNIMAIYKVMGGKWQYFIEEGYLLPVVFLQVLLLSTTLILLPVIAGNRADVIKRGNAYLGLLSYFAFLGIGFMFVEVSLIQKMILTIENPSYAVATVLTSILISSGIGSLLIQRLSSADGLRKPSILMIIPLLIIIYALFLPYAANLISPFSSAMKIALSFILLMPLGLLMGIPFPVGVKILGESAPYLIPWAWAINGSLSVLAPILAIMLAMMVGFKTVLFIGGGMYAMAFFTPTLRMPRP